MGELPSYDELPIRPDLPPGSSWGVWGDADVFGALNLLSPAGVLAGTACVQDGTTFALNLELELPAPPLFGRPAFEHEVLWLGGEAKTGHDDLLHGWNTQSSSQWDGFRHIRHPRHDFYGGLDDEQHGIHHWARRGIAGRGVLCDVAGYREADGRPLQYDEADAITAADVTGALGAQGVAIEPGDVLLLHTGWVTWYRSLDQEQRTALAQPNALRTPGLAPGDDTVRLLWDLHIAAIGADNPAVEVWPIGGGLSPDERSAAIAGDAYHRIFAHFALLPLLGIPLGELWELGPLAAACRADGRWTCLFVSAPINLEQGVASPPNAVAVR
jgi:kynurenine formamidase